MEGHQARLALHGRSREEAGTRQGGRKPPGCLVFVEITRFKLHQVHLGGLANPLQVTASEHGPLAQVRPEVVDEHPSVDVTSLGVSALQSNCFQFRWPGSEIRSIFRGSGDRSQEDDGPDWTRAGGAAGFSAAGARSPRPRRCEAPRKQATTASIDTDMGMAPPNIRLYNTFTRAKEELRPLSAGSVRIYSCGPTVYRYVHVGNLRTFMLPDLLCRSLEYLGYRTDQVMNITDVGHLVDDTFDRGEDKMLVSARLENKTPAEIAAYYTAAFMEDAAKLNIRRARQYPHASEFIPQMIELIAKLSSRGHAYDVGGTVYFDISSYPAYGKLSRNTTDKLLAGARGEVDPRKRHPGDFTLWKAAGEHRLQVWASPWGLGFPGWHIECSAMSMSLLGDRFDIHTGGSDNVFPHHEAEIAQSEGVTGHRVVNCWMHGGLLMHAGTRMAKSAGNFFRVSELEEQGLDPLAFRHLALQAKYRTKLNFSVEGLAGSDRALTLLRDRIADWSTDGKPGRDAVGFEDRFRAAIADDLDLPAAMALVAELVHSDVAPRAKASLILAWDRVLGLDLHRSAIEVSLPDGAAEMLESRQLARATRDYLTSDRLRDELALLGVAVTDTAEGQRWTATRRPAV
jgi:cysteinyl-tRNA synthetase